MIQNYYKLTITTLIVVWLMFEVSPVYSKAKAPEVKSGTLDLSSWKFEEDGIVELKGDWQFYWNQLLTPSNIDSGKLTGHLRYPHMWGTEKVGNETISSTGYATYRAKIKVPKLNGLYRVKVYECLSSYKLFVNGKLAIKLGETGTTLESSEPQGNTRFYSFEARDGNIDLVLQVSNFYLRSGGTYMPIKLGHAEQVSKWANIEMIIDAFLIGCILIMGIYHFALYILRRQNKTPLIFGIFCISLGLRAGLAGDGDFIFLVLPDMSWDWTKKLEFIGFYFGIASFYHFVQLIYPEEAPKWFLWFIWPVTILFSLYTVFTRALYFTDIIEYYQICTLVEIVIIVYSIVLATYRKKDGALIFLSGIAILFSATIHDIMLAHEMFSSMPMAPVGILGFIFAQSLLLSRRFSNAFTQIEIDGVKIRKMHNELIEKERARTLFFHNTSHELRTPLNGIIGFLEILKLNRYGKLPDRIRAQLDKISTLAHSLKLQVNTILDLAKEKKGELKLVNSLMNMNELVEYTQTLAEGLGKKEGVTFKLESSWEDDDVGEAEKNFISDKEKIHVVIRNLVGNAIKFKAEDRDNNVVCSLIYKDKKLIIKVKDTGIGISDEFRSKMFKEFEQETKDASRAYEGTGLGLAMVKKLVDLIGGTIDYTSIVGTGTTFTAVLPSQGQVDASQTVKEVESEGAPDVEDIGSHDDVGEDYEVEVDTATPIEEIQLKADKEYYVLVVDDNEVNLEVISEVLGLHGYHVDIADGGQKALEMLMYLERKPDLILLDLMMPEVSGEDVLREIKSNDLWRDIPVMLLTARASQDDKVLGLAMGADDYLAKPIENKELLLRVKNVLMRVDLARLMESYAYREKMAQVGELMEDISHELKNIHQAHTDSGETETSRVERLLGRLKFSFSEWMTIIKQIFSDPIGFNEAMENKKLMQIPDGLAVEDKRVYLNLSRIFRNMDIDGDKLRELWSGIIALDPEVRADMENIVVLYESIKLKDTAGQRAFKLVKSILDFSRGTETKECSMLSVIEDSKNLLSQRLKRATVSLQYDLDDSEVQANTSDMHQIAMNLIVNATHALEDTSDRERIIKIGQKIEGDHIIYKFEDNGTGIDQENIEKIFERKFSTKGEMGSGIGLFVSKRLTNKNMGHLSVESEPGRTVFELKLKKAA